MRFTMRTRPGRLEIGDTFSFYSGEPYPVKPGESPPALSEIRDSGVALRSRPYLHGGLFRVVEVLPENRTVYAPIRECDRKFFSLSQ